MRYCKVIFSKNNSQSDTCLENWFILVIIPEPKGANCVITKD